MVNYLRHYVAAFLVFAVMVTLYSNIYTDVEDAYNLTRTSTNATGSNVMEQLNSLNIITAMEDFQSAMYSIANPRNTFDLLGAMALAGFGVLRIIAAIILFPAEILLIVSGSGYYFPPIMSMGLVIISLIYVGFILVSAYLKERI